MVLTAGEGRVLPMLAMLALRAARGFAPGLRPPLPSAARHDGRGGVGTGAVPTFGPKRHLPGAPGRTGARTGSPIPPPLRADVVRGAARERLDGFGRGVRWGETDPGSRTRPEPFFRPLKALAPTGADRRREGRPSRRLGRPSPSRQASHEPPPPLPLGAEHRPRRLVPPPPRVPPAPSARGRRYGDPPTAPPRPVASAPRPARRRVRGCSSRSPRAAPRMPGGGRPTAVGASATAATSPAVTAGARRKSRGARRVRLAWSSPVPWSVSRRPGPSTPVPRRSGANGMGRVAPGAPPMTGPGAAAPAPAPAAAWPPRLSGRSLPDRRGCAPPRWRHPGGRVPPGCAP